MDGGNPNSAPSQRQRAAKACLAAGIASVPAALLFGAGLPLGIFAMAAGVCFLANARASENSENERRALVGVGSGGAGILLSILCLVFWAGFALPAAKAARDNVERMKRAENLRAIALAFKTYEADNGGELPFGAGAKGLQLLLSEKYLAWRGVFKSPRAKETPDEEPLTDEEACYLYLGSGLKASTASPDAPVLMEKLEPERGRFNVLFIDGHIESFPAERWSEIARLSANKP